MVVPHDGKPYDVSGLAVKDIITNNTTTKRIVVKIIHVISDLWFSSEKIKRLKDQLIHPSEEPP